MSIRASRDTRPRPVRLRLTGALALRDGQLQQRSVAIEDGRITKGPLPEVDLTGYYVLPGIVDLHGAGLDNLRGSLPRRADPAALFAAAGREAAAHGVTTGWLSLTWGREGGAAGPSETRRTLSLRARDARFPLIDLRPSLVCDIHAVDSRDALISAVRRHGVDLVHFAKLFGGPVTTGRHSVARDPSDTPSIRCDAAREVPRHLCKLAEAFDTLGVTYGSLDDPDGETRETYSMIGAKLCTRPAKRQAAALARAVGDPVLFSAAAVTDLGHGPRDAAVTDLVRAGLCNALVSDGSYAALPRAAFALAERGLMPLAPAWALVSSAPAAIIGLPDRGVIDYGKRADLALVNAATHAVEGTIVAGRIAHLSGAAAERFLSSKAEFALAAE